MGKSSLPPTEATADLMIKLLFSNQVDTTEHIPHETTPELGQQIASFIYHYSLVSVNKCFYSSGPGREGWLALKPKDDTSLSWRVNWGGVWQGRPSSESWGSGSETLRPLSLEATKGVVEKPSLIESQKSVLVILCLFGIQVWQSFSALVAVYI